MQNGWFWVLERIRSLYMWQLIVDPSLSQPWLLPLLSPGAFDGPRMGFPGRPRQRRESDALDDGRCLPQAVSSFAGVAVAEVAVAEFLPVAAPPSARCPSRGQWQVHRGVVVAGLGGPLRVRGDSSPRQFSVTARPTSRLPMARSSRGPAHSRRAAAGSSPVNCCTRPSRSKT